MSDPSAAMFHETTSGSIKESELINSGRDTTVQKTYNFNIGGENLVLVFPDVIGFIQIAAQLFVPWTRSADGQERDLVEISSMMPPDPSLLPVSSIADRYTRSILQCLAGYPLYEPQPLSELSTEYLRHGVNIGDVGFVRGDGAFDFLFNICPPQNSSINPPNLPDGFSLETHSETRATRPLSRETSLFPGSVTITESGEYVCEGSEGAILELPEGAMEDEAMNIRPFAKLAGRHGVQWYEYTMKRGREISNGSLYLITSSTTCTHWGIAVFNRPCNPGQGLTFVNSPIGWKGSKGFTTKVSDTSKGDTPNQCVFLRGYKIMIRQDIFDSLSTDHPCGSNPAMPSSSLQGGSITMTRQPATRIRGGGGTDFASTILAGKNPFKGTTMSTVTKSDKEVVLHANFSSSPAHPSDLINAALLNQSPDAKIALTHDDVWCDLLRDNFPKLNYGRLMDIARSYTSTIDEHGCVSLKKISDTSNVLDESNCPLQGAKIPTLQAPVTTRDDDNTRLPATIGTFPRELLERILLLLDIEYMLTCKLVNKEFNETIQSSALLQYFLACKIAGVIDNPQSPLSCVERLKALKKREDAWRKLKPVFETTITINRQTSSRICRSTEGIFFLTDENLKDLDYCHLTLFPQGNPRWNRFPGHGPALDRSGIVVNFAIALHEHDLIVNFISSDTENQADMQRYSLDLVLLKFSTGEYHPFASCSRIHVQKSPEVNPWIVSRIVGDNLALVVHSRDGTFSDKLIIIDWKTGRKLLQHKATENAYRSLSFISPEILLVPNRVISHFEVWHLPPQQLRPKPPVQILSLQIPIVSPDYNLFDFDCYGEPNLFLHSMPYLPPQPFFSSPESSIIKVTLQMLSNSRRRPSYNFIMTMHRRALLETIQTLTSPPLLEQQEHLSTWLANEVTVHQIEDPENESVQLETQSRLISTTPHPKTSPRTHDTPTFGTFHTSQTFPTSDISGDSGSSSISSALSRNSSASRCTFLQVPWAKWGPPISRWFEVNDTHARWITHPYGQRYAFSEPNPLDSGKLMVSVVDFNPHNFRRNAEMALREGEEEEKEEFEILDHKGVFSEEVYMGLKCVIYRAPDEYDFDLVLMDEERLFGVKLNRHGWEESIQILHIG